MTDVKPHPKQNGYEGSASVFRPSRCCSAVASHCVSTYAPRSCVDDPSYRDRFRRSCAMICGSKCSAMSFIGFPAAEVRDLLRGCLDSCGVCGGRDAHRPAHRRALSRSHRPAHRGANNVVVRRRRRVPELLRAAVLRLCPADVRGHVRAGVHPPSPEIRDLSARCR